MRFFAAVIDGRFLRFLFRNLILVRLRFTLGLAGLFLALVLTLLCFFRLLVLLSFVRLFTFSSVVGVVKRLVRHLRSGGIWLVLAKFDTLEVLLH